MDDLQTKIDNIDHRLSYFENIPTVIYDDSLDASRAVANEIAD